MKVGLTGGIGSGKSTVAKLLEIMGCAVFNSDQEAKDIYQDTTVKEKVITLLGKACYAADGSINKTYISSKVFSDTLLLHQLNAIIHPAVKVKMQEFERLHKGKIIVKETALLFEAHLEKEVDKVLVIAAKEELRIQRVMLRDGLTKAEVLLRIKKQIPQEEKIAKADFVIHNNNEELLIPQVIEVLNKIRN